MDNNFDVTNWSGWCRSMPAPGVPDEFGRVGSLGVSRSAPVVGHLTGVSPKGVAFEIHTHAPGQQDRWLVQDHAIWVAGRHVGHLEVATIWPAYVMDLYPTWDVLVARVGRQQPEEWISRMGAPAASFVSVNSDVKGLGLGTSAYLLVAAMHRAWGTPGLRSHGTPAIDAVNLWQRLESAGLAVRTGDGSETRRQLFVKSIADWPTTDLTRIAYSDIHDPRPYPSPPALSPSYFRRFYAKPRQPAASRSL